MDRLANKQIDRQTDRQTGGRTDKQSCPINQIPTSATGATMVTHCFVMQPEWAFVDPICTFVFSVLVLGTTYTVLRDGIHILMEGIVNLESTFSTPLPD